MARPERFLVTRGFPASYGLCKIIKHHHKFVIALRQTPCGALVVALHYSHCHSAVDNGQPEKGDHKGRPYRYSASALVG
jgi:hypothetical protein